MTLVYLVRHGQASFGAASYDQLSALGYEQAKYVGEQLSSFIPAKPLVVSGTMQRHQQTAHTALAATPWSNVPLLQHAHWNEFNHQQVFARYDPRFADPDLLKQEVAKNQSPRAYLAAIFQGAIQRWVSGEADHDYDETWQAFRSRVRTGLGDLKQHLLQEQHSHAVVFSSGGAISVAVGEILGLQPQQVFELNWSIANCSLTCLRLQDGRWQFVSFNEHQYLQLKSPHALTWI